MLFKVHLPLLRRPALGAAALLVFLDSMKELPATLLLRPFNFDTLATQVFTLVSLYRTRRPGSRRSPSFSSASLRFSCCTGSSPEAGLAPRGAAGLR
jgi:hypothetical protein